MSPADPGISGGSSDFERAAGIFEQLVELAPAERAAALAAHAHEPAAVLELVERLLAGDDGAVTALDRPVVRTAGGGPPVPERVGPYEIRGVIGAGGMGVVYEAVQESPRRTVALKLVRPGLVSDELLRRFRKEAEVLGWLNHPGVAQVFEAGTACTAAGEQPYIAMELIRGERIDRHVERARLTTSERLELIAALCDAVQHAHQKGVVHRDLKPANVLVTEHGQLKVLDFGVAHIVDAELESTELHTRAGELLGTLPYMSPEQVAANPAQVDTRTDVYAVGAIAYELLAGQRPIDTRERSLPEAVRMITEDEPTTLGLIDRRLRGDVEVIVGKALAKEKERRYGSADELAADIRRHLADQPILARPPTRAYQLAKFARRNRGLVAGAVLAFLVLLVGALTSTALYYQSQRNLARAQTAEGEWRTAAAQAEVEAGLAREVSDFLVDLFEVSDPSGVAGARTPALEFLERGREQIATRLAGQPAVRAELMHVMGRVYYRLGQYDTAAPMLAKTIEVLRAEDPPDPVELASVLFALGEVRHYQGDLEAARPLYAEALELREACLSRHDADLARTLDVYGRLFRDLGGAGNHARARELIARAHQLRIEGGADDMELSESLQSEGSLAFNEGDLVTAEELMSEVLEIREAHPERHYDLPEILHSLGKIAAQRGDGARAEALYRQCLTMSRQVFGEDHVFVAHPLIGLATEYSRRGRFAESHELLREARGLVRERDQALAELVELTLAFLLHDQGRLEEAEVAYRGYIELTRQRLGPRHPHVAMGLSNLSNLLIDQKRWSDAEQVVREALRIFAESEPGGTTHCIATRNLARCLSRLGHHDEAVERGYEALALERTSFGESSPAYQESVGVLAEILERAGRGEEASRVRADLP